MIYNFTFLKHDEDAFSLMKNMCGKRLVFGHLHVNKILFCFFIIETGN